MAEYRDSKTADRQCFTRSALHRQPPLNPLLGLMIYCFWLVAAPLVATAANPESGQLLRALPMRPRRFSTLLLCGVAVLALSACASNRTSSSMRSPDFSSMSAAQAHATLGELA